MANTTIVSVIRQLEDDDIDESRIKHELVRPSQLRAQDVEELDRSFFKFVFVRNPYTRVLSAYSDKIAGDRRQAIKFHRWASRKGLSGDASFSNFCRYLGEAGLYEDPHWAPQVDCLLMRVSKFDFIGSIENLEIDLPMMLTRALRNEVKVDIPRRNATNSSESVREYYSPREIDIVKELYKSDFEVFGYPAAFPPR